jgi:mono/diheme cytochrome c family protein
MKSSIQRSMPIIGLLLLSMLAAACVQPPNIAPTDIPPSPTPLPLPGVMSTMVGPMATASGPMEMPAASADLTGVSLYRLSCAACHGQDRAGNTFEDEGQSISVPALAWDDLNSMYVTQPNRGSVNDQLVLAITKGQDETGEDMVPMMPRWSSLSPAQLESLIEYFQTADTTSTANSDLSPAAMNLKGEQLYLTACAACHGVDGAGKTFEKEGNTISTPSLHWSELSDMYAKNPGRGGVEDQLTLAITKGLDESGDEMNLMMPRWSFLSKAQVESLIQYLQTAFK